MRVGPWRTIVHNWCPRRHLIPPLPDAKPKLKPVTDIEALENFYLRLEAQVLDDTRCGGVIVEVIYAAARGSVWLRRDSVLAMPWHIKNCFSDY